MSQPALLTLAEVLVRGNNPAISGVLPATAKVILTPLKISAVDAASGENTFAVPGDGEQIDGFLLKASATTKGSSLENLLFGAAETGGEPATPYEVSKPGTIQLFEEMEFEGSDYLQLADTGLIDGTTPAGTELAMNSSGLWKTAASGDFVQYKVRAQKTPKVTSGVRIQIFRCHAYTKA